MTEIDFQENWFSAPHKTSTTPTQELWEKHLLPVKHEINSYLEIGVCEGHSMRWILENIEPSRAIGVDPYIAPRRQQKQAFEQYKLNAEKNLQRWLESEQLRMIYKPSLEWLGEQVSQKCPEKYDLVFVDGCHLGVETMTDMMLSFHLVSHEGRIVIDDMQRSMHSNKPLTFWAASFFRLICKDRLRTEWEEGRQLCLRRIKTRAERRQKQA